MNKNYEIYTDKKMILEACVGKVIDRWATLENQLLILAAWGLDMDMHDTSRLTSSFKSFSLSLDFTQSLCAPRMKSRAYLNSLVDLIRESSGDRNFIAHTQIVSHGDAPSFEEIDWQDVTPRIGPAMKDFFAESIPKRDPMDAQEVANVAKDIQHLISLTMEFVAALQEGLPLNGKFAKPIVPRRPRLARRRAESDKAPKPPQRA